MESFEVVKASGERQKFKLSKLKRSLGNAGAEPAVIKQVIDHLQEQDFFRDGISTKKIYHEAYRLIKKKSKRVASKYKLKESLLEMGPSGYPFEQLIAALFTALEYQTQVGKVVQGVCVTHEIDVIAKDDQKILLMECKFHNRQAHRCNVAIPLYVNARYQDVAESWATDPSLQDKKSFGYIVTNTRFTEDAVTYAECRNLKVLSWDYPQNMGLKSLLEDAGIYPITVLSSLTKKEKKSLLEHDVVHCKQLLEASDMLEKLRFNHIKRKNILAEVEELLESEDFV